MGTRNFRPMEYGMPLVCGSLDFDALKDAYERETGEEYTEGMYYWDQEDFINEAIAMAERFTENLKFHSVTVVAGYYDGFQFWVEENHKDDFSLERESEYCIDNEDARYYFDMCRSKVLRAAEAEKRKIEKWLENLDGNGFEILVCVGVYSNGYAIYDNRNNRKSALKAALLG